MATNHHMAQNHKKKLSKLEKIRDTGIQIQTEDICFFHDCELCSFFRVSFRSNSPGFKTWKVGGPASTDWSLTSGCSGSSFASGIAYRKCGDLVRLIVEIETKKWLCCKPKSFGHLIYIIVCVLAVGINVYSLQGAKNLPSLYLSRERKKGHSTCHFPIITSAAWINSQHLFRPGSTQQVIIPDAQMFHQKCWCLGVFCWRRVSHRFCSGHGGAWKNR